MQTKSLFFVLGVGSVQPVALAPHGFVAQSLVFTTHTPPTDSSVGDGCVQVQSRPFWQLAPVVHGVHAVDSAPQALPVEVHTPAALHFPPASQLVRPVVQAPFTFVG